MRYRLFLFFFFLEVLVLILMIASGELDSSRRASVRTANMTLVETLGLTDLSLWTGARYTRHMSQADTFAAFQDSMGALERFPEGALSPLPPQVTTVLLLEKEADDDPAF